MRAVRSRWETWSERLRSSLWAIPTTMVAASVGGAATTLALDRHHTHLAGGWGIDMGVEGARVTLATIAGSVLTVAGVAFSMTMVVLQLASTQYSPRIVRIFRRDRLIQFVFGAYTGTFTYSLLVLRTIATSEDGPPFTAPISVTLATVLGVTCMILLITLVHHVARSVQVSTAVRHVSKETRDTMDRLFPDEPAGPARDEDVGAGPPEPEGEPWTVHAKRDGYVDYVDDEAVDALDGAVLVRIHVCVGDFVRAGEALASVWPASAGTLSDNRDLGAAIVLAEERTMLQDPRFGFRLIVDIALRALSPAVNDPATAVHCVDALGGLVCDLAGRRIPSAWRRTSSGLAVYAPIPSFDEMLGLALDEILHASQSALTVQVAVARALGALGARCQTPARRAAVERAVERARRVVARSRWDADQRDAISKLLDDAISSPA